MAYIPSHFGVQALPSEITKARLYVVGAPAESLPTAVVALTYGAYEVADDFVVPGFGDAFAAVVRPGRADDVSEAPPVEEHPAQARAARQTIPAAGLRKLRIVYAPALVMSRDFCLRTETNGRSPTGNVSHPDRIAEWRSGIGIVGESSDKTGDLDFTMVHIFHIHRS
jgi:hypothetical protein